MKWTLALVLVCACGTEPDGEKPTEAQPQEDMDRICSPERPNGRSGCMDEDGACLTYDCCVIDGCGPSHDDCDCCGFDDAPADEC